MFNVCPRCGEYAVEKTIEPTGLHSANAVCPYCHYAYTFLRQPLFIITGASGSGKSTVCLELVARFQDCVVIESDILWGIVQATPEDDYQDYRNVWLRLAKNIGQAGKAVVLCGTALPQQFETCPERRYFSTLHYLAMACDDRLLAERLRSRPAWRHSDSVDIIERMMKFNRWLKEHAEKTLPAMTLYDTSNRSVELTVEEVARWIREHLERG